MRYRLENIVTSNSIIYRKKVHRGKSHIFEPTSYFLARSSTTHHPPHTHQHHQQQQPGRKRVNKITIFIKKKKKTNVKLIRLYLR